MKTDIHPNYRPVVFTSDTIEWEDGNTYPLHKVEISSASHPFFTGQMKIVDTAGRVERFERRFGRRRKTESAEPEATDSES